MSSGGSIRRNLEGVRHRIADAARRAGRDPSSVTLVAATKYVGLDAIRELVEAGCVDLGESRPQQLWEKVRGMAGISVRWHMIGHLQRNKAKRTLPLVHLLHSADNRPLLEALDPLAHETGRRAAILLEVNISGEPAKHGFAPADMPAVIDSLPQFENLEVRGLMCMAGLEGDADRARREFGALRELRDSLAGRLPDGHSLAELSMGMSGDFEAAIEEGATMVRIGSALFEPDND